MINGHVLKLEVKTGYKAHFRFVGVSARSCRRRRPRVTDVSESQNSKYDDLGPDRQVVVIVPSAVHVQVDAAMRFLGEASAVEGDPARGKEHGVLILAKPLA